MTTTGNRWQDWQELFSSRAARPAPTLESDLDYTRLPRSLARSLAVFQLGESGGGTVINQARQSELVGHPEDYAEAIRLFVAEEHRHADILAVCVRLLGGELLRENWTARLFVFGRRLIGLRLKIMVLLAAEVVGLCYYRLIASRLPPCALRDRLLEIADDEKDHLEFHCDFLRGQVTSRFRQLIFLSTWRTLMLASEIVVLLDHREALRELYIDQTDVKAAWAGYRRQIEQKVCAGSSRKGRRAPFPDTVTTA